MSTRFVYTMPARKETIALKKKKKISALDEMDIFTELAFFLLLLEVHKESIIFTHTHMSYILLKFHFTL